VHTFLLAATAIHYPKEVPGMSDKSKAQEIYERVEAVVAEQKITKKEAQVIVGKEFDMKPSSIRGAEYQARKELGLVRNRVQETTPDNAVASAIATLEKARDGIDNEVDAAKERADEAKAEYDALKDSAPDRKAEIDSKIDALKA
jgi:hypothetical protein